MNARLKTLGLVLCLVAVAAAGEPPSCTERGYLRIGVNPEDALQPPGKLLLIDPQGRKLASDARLRGSRQVPQAWFSLEGLEDAETGEPGPTSGIFEICNPLPGSYTLKVFGATSGRYQVEVHAASREVPDARGMPDAKSSYVLLHAAYISSGAVHRYEIRYSNLPGSRVQARRLAAAK